MNRILAGAGGIFLLAPVMTFLYVAQECVRIYNGVSRLPAGERPAALAAAIDGVAFVHYYGILGYYLGIALMVYLLNKGFKKEAGMLWILAISTVIFVCVMKTFALGILTAAILIWKRKTFRPSPVAIQAGVP